RGHDPAFQDRLNQTVVLMHGYVKDFDVDNLKRLAQRGHRIAETMEGGAFEARIAINPPGTFVAEVLAGELEDAFAEPKLSAAHNAYQQGRGEALLRLCGDLNCTLEVTLLVDPRV